MQTFRRKQPWNFDASVALYLAYFYSRKFRPRYVSVTKMVKWKNMLRMFHYLYRKIGGRNEVAPESQMYQWEAIDERDLEEVWVRMTQSEILAAATKAKEFSDRWDYGRGCGW